MAPGTQAALAALRGAAPAYKRYLTSGNALPSVEELSELHTQLQALRDDADRRLDALLTERGRSTSTTTTTAHAPAVQVKREDDEAARVHEGPEWEDAARPGRTYGRQRRIHTPKDEASSELDSEPESDGGAAKVVAPRLGVKLRMHTLQTPRAAEPRHTPVLAPDTEPFTDETTFSWEAPRDVATSVLPQCEPVRPPPYYPTHPLDVHEDFANKDWRDRDAPHKDAGRGRQSKDTSQVPATTFYNYADAFFKPITEDDLAWLSSKNDDPYPFQFPELGTHYKKVWEKEDAELLGMLQGEPGVWPRTRPDEKPAGQAGNEAPTTAASLSELRDADMYSRTTTGGPLLERLAAALLLPARGEEGRWASGDDRAVAPPPDTHKSIAEIEAQARQECEAIGLLDANVAVQWQEHVDGPIASALRLAQARLRAQIQANEARKARLFRVAQDRMAFQDYQACLTAVDREIEAAWTKRMRQIKASMGKKRKGAPDEGPSRPQLPDTLPAALERRKQLKAAFEPLFAKMPHARGPPRESIY